MKTFALIICAAFGMHCLSSALAGTVTLTSVGGRKFTDQSGTPLPAGAAIRVGTFNLPPATRDQTLHDTSDYATLTGWFKPLGEAISGAGSIAQANGAGSQLRANGFPSSGEIFGTIANVSGSYMAPGTKLYVWIFNAANPRDSSQWGIFTAAEWVVPPAMGATALSTKGSVNAIQGDANSGQLLLGTPAPTYGNWAMKHFPADAPGSTTAFSADPDGDGIHNLAEYGWQLNPNAKDEPRSHVDNGTPDEAKFIFKTPRHLSDVTVIAECSTDLNTWTPAASTVTESDADFDTRTCTAEPGAARYFWRVRFSSAAP